MCHRRLPSRENILGIGNNCTRKRETSATWIKNCIACTIIKPGGTALLSHVKQNRRKDLHIQARPETHTKRQATQHDCMPSLLGGGYKLVEIVYGEGKKLVLGRLEQARQDQNVLYTGTISPTNQPRKDPLHLYSMSPHLSQLQQSAGATPL